MKRERERIQLTIPISAELRSFLEELAAQEHRTLSGQVRALIAAEQHRVRPAEQAAS
jgi:hypothetical protein